MTEREHLHDIETALTLTKINLAHEDAMFLLGLVKKLMGNEATK